MTLSTRPCIRTLSTILVTSHILITIPSTTNAFLPTSCYNRRTSFLRMSSVGGGSKDNYGGGGKGNNNNDDAFNDWLDPLNRDDGEKDANKIRKQRADARLPINYRTDTGTRDEEFDLPPDDKENDEIPSSTSALKRIQSGKVLSNIDYTKNPYFDTVSRLAPSEMILRFTTTSHPRVQDAVKSTILGLIGTLPRMKTEGDAGDDTNGFSTTTVTTAERLAGLMFQLQMTGYMFKNAEYRMALSHSVEHLNQPKFLLQGSSLTEVEVREEEEDSKINGKVRGKVQVQYSKTKMEIDADAYVSELRSEIKRLRDEIALAKTAKEEERAEQDLLSYIRNLPPQEMRELTGSMTEDVLSAMKGLVNAVMAGISKSEDGEVKGIAPDTVLEQSGEAMAQLCMWQLVSGYNLRELEVREEMKLKLKSGSDRDVESNDAKVQDDDDDEFIPGLESGGME